MLNYEHPFFILHTRMKEKVKTFKLCNTIIQIYLYNVNKYISKFNSKILGKIFLTPLGTAIQIFGNRVIEVFLLRFFNRNMLLRIFFVFDFKKLGKRFFIPPPFEVIQMRKATYPEPFFKIFWTEIAFENIC